MRFNGGAGSLTPSLPEQLEELVVIKEFKAFIMRGNVLDLAVAVIIGAAFGAIVNSMVNDIVMPPIGLLLSGVDFKLNYRVRDLPDRTGREPTAKAGRRPGAGQARVRLLPDAHSDPGETMSPLYVPLFRVSAS